MALSRNAIELKNVAVTRRGNAILADVSLSVEAGSCCAIIGPNGSGKSALMAVLAGYLWPSTGSVCVDGRTYGRVNLADVRREIGLIEPSRAPKFDDRMCVRDVVATGLFGTIVLMKGGTVVGQGKPDDLLTSAHLTQLFDCRVEVIKSDGRFLANVRPVDTQTGRIECRFAGDIPHKKSPQGAVQT